MNESNAPAKWIGCFSSISWFFEVICSVFPQKWLILNISMPWVCAPEGILSKEAFPIAKRWRNAVKTVHSSISKQAILYPNYKSTPFSGIYIIIGRRNALLCPRSGTRRAVFLCCSQRCWQHLGISILTNSIRDIYNLSLIIPSTD